MYPSRYINIVRDVVTTILIHTYLYYPHPNTSINAIGKYQ